MRGAPQSGLARDICRMRAIVSGATVLRPAFRARLFQRQKRRNPCRCQWITVSGWTSRSAFLHLLQATESQTQRTRSTIFHRDRLVFLVKTRSWCRKAAFSNNKFRRDFRALAVRPTTKQSQRIIWQRLQENPVAAQHFIGGLNYCHPQAWLNC